MTETAQPTGATGTSSTPDATASAAQPAASAAAPQSVEAKPAQPAAQPAAQPVTAQPAATPDAPLFKLPDDMKVSDGARTKFETVIKGKMKDGALQLSPQDVVDLYAEQARDAYAEWQQQTVAQDASWKAESEKRFSKPQLAAAETGVGFLSSFDPQFRDLTKGIANHPAFVNAMRVIGERLSEDNFEIEGSRNAVTARKSAAEVLYGKRN